MLHFSHYSISIPTLLSPNLQLFLRLTTTVYATYCHFVPQLFIILCLSFSFSEDLVPQLIVLLFHIIPVTIFSYFHVHIHDIVNIHLDRQFFEEFSF